MTSTIKCRHVLVVGLVTVVIISPSVGRIPYRWTHLEQECPDEKSPHVINPQVPWGLRDRAYRTIPEGFSLRRSKVLKADLGIFANYFVASHTWLGEYEGAPLPACQNETNPCVYFPKRCSLAFEVERGGEITSILDAEDLATSNWLRWINCARNSREENIRSRECMGKIYFQTIKPIIPGDELYVYYGDEYAKHLGVYEEFESSFTGKFIP